MARLWEPLDNYKTRVVHLHEGFIPFSAVICGWAHLRLLELVASCDSLCVPLPFSYVGLRDKIYKTSRVCCSCIHVLSDFDFVSVRDLIAEKTSLFMSIPPGSMASRGSPNFGYNYGRGGTSRVFLTATKGGRPASPGEDELPLGDEVVSIHAADISPSAGSARISNFRCIASYNWLDSSKPVILIPGISVPCCFYPYWPMMEC